MIVLLSLATCDVLCPLLAAPVAFLHDGLPHRRPRPLEGLRVATAAHPRVEAVPLLSGELFTSQAQTLLFLPAGEIFVPQTAFLGLLPLPLNLRIYVHVCFVSFANSANYLYGLAPHTYGVSHVLATSRYILFSLVGFAWVVRAVATILTAHARRLLNCFHQRPCSCFFRCLRLCLVRPRDRVLGRKDPKRSAPEPGRDPRLQISAKIEFYKVIAAHVASWSVGGAPSSVSGSCPSPSFRPQLIPLGLRLVIGNQDLEDGPVALRLSSVVFAPCEAVLFASAGVVGRHASLPQFVPLVGVSLP